jgi:hypothetical protein
MGTLLVSLCAPILPRISEKIVQPIRSLKIAALTTIMPRSVRYRLRSISVLAITGNAVIDIAVAKNNANTIASASGSRPNSTGIAHAPANPVMNGIRMPSIPTLSAVRPCFQTIDRSISSPATSRNRTIDSVPIP